MSEPAPLERLRRQLALAVGDNAVFDGWTVKALETAARQAGIAVEQARLVFSKKPAEMFATYVDGVDRALEEWASGANLDKMKIRKRIRALIWRRLEIMGSAREAVRSAMSILAMPQNLPLAARLNWSSADVMWRLAGDISSDFNHYTKRLTLGVVYGTTLLTWIDDSSQDWAETAAFLDRRIDNVMQFEKLKAQWGRSSERRPSLARFLGRLRYPPL